MESQLLYIIEDLAYLCKRFAEDVEKEFNSIGCSLGIAYDIQFEHIQNEIQKLQNDLKE